MDAIFNFYSKILAFGDRTVNSNPKLRLVDWERQIGGVSVSDCTSKGFALIPGETKTIFDGTRALTIDGTTAFSLSLLTNSSSTYRITHTAGTAPGFRTGRNLTLNTCSVTFVINSNNTVTLTVSGASDFTNVVSGDMIFIPHTTTGDAANVLNVLNAGYWQVLAKNSNTNLVIARLAGTTFEGVGETVALTANTQLRAYSASGVQIDDTLTVSSGFSTSAQTSFKVSNVTDLFVEFTSTLPLPNETGVIPTASGLAVYTDAKRLLYLESDQDCVLRLNGDSGNSCRLSPIEAGNPDSIGPYFKWGHVYSLVVVNKSTSTLNLTVITAE